DLGSPRNTIPKALVKQKIASPPISDNAAIDPTMSMEWKRLAPERLPNIPIYIRYSEIKPLNGGSPQIASDPVRNRMAVHGIRFIRPPVCSILRVWAAR